MLTAALIFCACSKTNDSSEQDNGIALQSSRHTEHSINDKIADAGRALLFSKLTICNNSMFLKRLDDDSFYDKPGEKHYVYFEIKTPSVSGSQIPLTDADILNRENQKGNLIIQFSAERGYRDRYKEWSKWTNGDLKVLRIENSDGSWRVDKYENWYHDIIKFDCSELPGSLS